MGGHLKYIKLAYSLNFEEEPIWENPPSFVFRSVLGQSLRNLTCILRQQKNCSECMVRNNCVYSIFFETNINKDSSILEGRNKGAHPFVLEVKCIDKYNIVIEIVFIGKAINYIPYINIALENAGKKGVGRNRAFYKILNIKAGYDLFDINSIDNEIQQWPTENVIEKSIAAIVLETPCRIKKQGHLISEITLNDLLGSIYLRMQVLYGLFSENSFSPVIDHWASVDCEIVNQRWVEQSYYSSRQQSLMKLGGVVGEIKIQEKLSSQVIQYIEAMELFHVGKNISFGLGKIKVVYE